MKIALSLIFFILVPAHAALVEDVNILELKHKKDCVELRLKAKQAKSDSYFIVDLVKEDEKSFDKLALLLTKLKKGEAFKLNLEIQSFSESPAGSYYRSPSVSFTGIEK